MLHPAHSGGAEHGGARSEVLVPLLCLDSGSYKGSERTSCPHGGLFWGILPTVLKSSRGGGAAGWPGCYLLVEQIGWHRLAGYSGAGSSAYVHGCIPAQAQGWAFLAGRRCRRTEHGHNPAALAVSSQRC